MHNICIYVCLYGNISTDVSLKCQSAGFKQKQHTHAHIDCKDSVAESDFMSWKQTDKWQKRQKAHTRARKSED